MEDLLDLSCGFVNNLTLYLINKLYRASGLLNACGIHKKFVDPTSVTRRILIYIEGQLRIRKGGGSKQ